MNILKDPRHDGNGFLYEQGDLSLLKEEHYVVFGAEGSS